MPLSCRADIKRPDFLAAIEGMSTVAVDAKAKAFIKGHVALDASEPRRLDGFESMFGTPVWYVCFPPEEPQLAYIFRNRDLMGAMVVHDPAKVIILAALTLGFAVALASISFAASLLRADAPPALDA
jgi:hypothetical protein